MSGIDFDANQKICPGKLFPGAIKCTDEYLFSNELPVMSGNISCSADTFTIV